MVWRELCRLCALLHSGGYQRQIYQTLQALRCRGKQAHGHSERNGTRELFGKREAKHNNPEHIVSESFGYAVSTDPDFFNGKNVILFDDLITTGTTAETFAEELEAVGANVLGAMFLARTVLVNK